MKRTLYILGGAACVMLLPHSLRAQNVQPKDTTVSRTVVVEQEYNPDILDAAKVNVLPKVEAPTVGKKSAEYATTLFPATSIPGFSMNPYSGEELQPAFTPGYVRAGYGNYGNLDLFANYLFRLSGKDRLNIGLQVDGMNGELDKLSQANPERKKWDAHYYRTRAGADYTHLFDRFELNANGNFGLSNFNYQPGGIHGKQKFTSGDVQTGIRFTDETAPFRFNATAGVLMYERRQNGPKQPGNEDYAIKETILRFAGGVTGMIGDRRNIGIGFELNNFRYGGYTKDPHTQETLLKGYTALQLNPSYELDTDDWRLHLGAKVDLSFGFGSSYRIAPDVDIQYVFADSYVLYARATGGQRINDFRRMEQINPYSELPVSMEAAGEPRIAQLRGTHEQVNGSLGFKAGPYPGLWFHVYGGYQRLKDEIFTESVTIPTGAEEASFFHFGQADANNFYAGGEATYEYKDLFAVSARYTYRNWKCRANEHLLAVKPAGELSFNTLLRPIANLTLKLGYTHIGRKEVKNYMKMQAVNDLHAGVDYNLFKGISAYARVHNLLNKKYQYYPGYSAEGLNVLGGLSFRF
ncbi:MAG: TonB-dependent receptor [Bacteroides pyogenes]|uniref:TonB-dependent receptor n=1 Tax=Bacteroides pyogenes TaxID=310300 RepID=UPI002431333C|nr:TonB-dependent receptor [Bacteroides pyogenes]MCI7070607.1 TonB-dependent receptor [Bacteroides pyogenes]